MCAAACYPDAIFSGGRTSIEQSVCHSLLCFNFIPVLFEAEVIFAANCQGDTCSDGTNSMQRTMPRSVVLLWHLLGRTSSIIRVSDPITFLGIMFYLLLPFRILKGALFFLFFFFFSLLANQDQERQCNLTSIKENDPLLARLANHCQSFIISTDTPKDQYC